MSIDATVPIPSSNGTTTYVKILVECNLGYPLSDADALLAMDLYKASLLKAMLEQK